MNERIKQVFIGVLIVYAIAVSAIKIKTQLLETALVERERLLVMKQQTEMIISRDADVRTRQVFRNLGYTIREPKPQPVVAPETKKTK